MYGTFMWYKYIINSDIISLWLLCNQRTRDHTIWLKIDLYLRYHIGDLITPHYMLCSVIIISSNQIATSFQVSRISDVLILCLNRLQARGYMKNTALHLKHAIWLDNNMMQYEVQIKFTWTRNVMVSYQIL